MSLMTTNYVNPSTDDFEQAHGLHGRIFVDAATSGLVKALWTEL